MPRHTTHLTLITALLLAATAPADDKDPTKPLDAFVGAWDVVVKYKMPDGKEYEGKTTCVTKRVLNDRYVQQEYKSTLMNQPLVIWQILGYDVFKKRYTQHYLSAHGTESHTTQTEGAFADDGKTLTLRGDSIDGFTGKPVKLRFVTTFQDADHYTLEWYLTDDTGKEDRKVVLTHTKRK